MFVDEARIFIKAGDGGKGCESFYQDKYTRYPIPDGGNGGKGGDVVFLADSRVHTLLDFRFRQHFKGIRGGHASSKGKKGKDGEDVILRVPQGTILWDEETHLLIKDLTSSGQAIVVAKGGNGGRGNRGNRSVTPPKSGEERTVRLELKIIADVGVIGFPNAGKSTLVSQISKVKSKIANYPFTTLNPILGVVETEQGSFVIADLPGLIEGAHQGRGLGDRFLKHAERTKILIHLIDMAGTEGRDPLEDYEKIRKELELYSDKLFFKATILVANKMDVPEAGNHLKRFKRKYHEPIMPVSALEKKGLQKLVTKISDILSKCADE
jgi:GTPase